MKKIFHIILNVNSNHWDYHLSKKYAVNIQCNCLMCCRPPFDVQCLIRLVQIMKDRPITWRNTVSPICKNFIQQLCKIHWKG